MASMAQIILLHFFRLQRVTFLALHQYLGLGAELLMTGYHGGRGVGSHLVRPIVKLLSTRNYIHQKARWLFKTNFVSFFYKTTWLY